MWEELYDIIRYGSKELFADENDEATKSRIHYDDAAIDRYMMYVSYIYIYGTTTKIRPVKKYVDLLYKKTRPIYIYNIKLRIITFLCLNGSPHIYIFHNLDQIHTVTHIIFSSYFKF